MSFNISSKNKKTFHKINAVTRDKADIIFLCDIRLNTIKQSYSVHDLEKNSLLKVMISSTIQKDPVEELVFLSKKVWITVSKIPTQISTTIIYS